MPVTSAQRGFRFRYEGIVAVAASLGSAGRRRPCVDRVFRAHAGKARDCSGADGQYEQEAEDSSHRGITTQAACPEQSRAKTDELDEADEDKASILRIRQCEMHLSEREAGGGGL
jgi:hypothetical protein